MLSGRGELAGAEAEYRAAIATLGEVVADPRAKPEHRGMLATSRNNLGALLVSRGQRSEAEAEHRAAVAIEEQLVAEFPAVSKYRVSLGATCCNYGRLVHTGGNPEAGLPWYDQAVVHLTTAAAQQPEDATVRAYLGASHTCRAKAFEGLKRYAEAAAELTRVIELSPAKDRPGYRAGRATALHLAGRSAEAVAEVAELAESDGWGTDQWYNFACAYSAASVKLAGKREEYAARAVELLAKAVAKGFDEPGHLAADGDLDPLRGRADFRKLVADLEAKHPQPPK